MVIAMGLVSPAVAVSEKELFDTGVNYLKLDKFQEAVDTFTALIDMAPGNPDAYKNRGVAYMKLSLYDQAIKDFERTKQIMPNLKGLYSNLGVAWYYKADFPRAIENYDMEISQSPDNHFAYFNRAICRYELKDYDESLKDITKTLSLSPEFYLALCLKGDLLSKMNQAEKAKQAYEKAILIDPDQAYAKEQLAALKLDSKPMADLPKYSVPVKAAVVEQKKMPDPRSLPAGVGNKIEKTSSPGVSALVGKYELQTGAYRVRDNAVDMQKKLEKAGYEAKLLELTRPNQIVWYLVRTGIYATKEEAQTARAILENEAKTQAVVRPFGQF